MFTSLVILYVLILSFVNTNAVDQTKEKTNLTLPVPKETLQDGYNKTKLTTVISEGGVILPISPALTLPKEKHTILEEFDVDLDNDKKKSIKPRKGAILDSVEGTDNMIANITKSNFTLNKNDDKVVVNQTAANDTKITNTSNSSSTSTPKVHKPLILSAEAIANTDEMNNEPNTDDLDERIVKIHTITANGHPGMVMPIVITILVVPLFAVVGYMALKKGQEAWKNRHYKRMDFLLDGMYND